MTTSQIRRSSRSPAIQRLLASAIALVVVQMMCAQDSPTPRAQGCPGGPAGEGGLLLERVNVSAAILGSTQRQQTYSGQITALANWHADATDSSACGWPYQRTLVDLPISYDEKRSGKMAPNVTRNYGATLQHTVFLLSNGVFGYGVADLYHNNSLGVYMRQSYGGGFGFTHGRLEFDGDLRFVGEHFYAPAASVSFLGIGLKGKYDIPLAFVRRGTVLSLTEQFVPALSQSHTWFSNGGAFLAVPINSKFAMTVTAQDNYLPNAPVAFRRNYFKTGIGIQYSPK